MNVRAGAHRGTLPQRTRFQVLMIGLPISGFAHLVSASRQVTRRKNVRRRSPSRVASRLRLGSTRGRVVRHHPGDDEVLFTLGGVVCS